MLRRTFPALVFVVALGSVTGVATASEVPIVVVSTPPLVDGNVDTPAWSAGTLLPLTHELTFGKVAPGDASSVRVLADRTNLYLGFKVQQAAPVTDTQKTDGVGWGSDDGVGIALWPGGVSGFSYVFEANPSGTNYQSSSENTAYAPRWKSVGRHVPNGYEVTMEIPLSALKNDGRDGWLVQPYQRISKTQQYYVWYFAPGESIGAGPTYAGTLTGMKAVAVVKKPPPRASVYGLTDMQPQAYGGPTSRIGGDFSLPLTSTISAFGTLHPDYSNVEVDQQTIVPTQFARSYSEVRPFFTQASSFYNPAGTTDLYTPAIPTPADGFAYEGVSGHFQSAAFDAQGDDRDDNATVLTYGTPNNTFGTSVQRVEADLPALTDTTTTGSADYNNNKDFTLYGSFGTDNDTGVQQQGLNHQIQLGTGLYGPKNNLYINYASIDPNYQPVDGYVPHADIRGLIFSGAQEFDFSSTSEIQKLNFNALTDRYFDHFGMVDQLDDAFTASMTLRQTCYFWIDTASSYTLEPGHGLTPFNQGGAQVSYYPHPSLSGDAGFRSGHYLSGFLETTYWDTTLPLGHVGRTLVLDYYKTAYTSPAQLPEDQTLFRISSNWELSKDASFSIGWRTIAGSAPSFASIPYGVFPPLPYARDVNLSASFTQRLRLGNLYAVYGDPNSTATTPAFILKLVIYALGQQGT